MPRRSDKVALLAEGVDRNTFDQLHTQVIRLSPSSRRAWIEMRCLRCFDCRTSVALLAEGVDRNFLNVKIGFIIYVVALLAEGVDRNWNARSAAASALLVALLAEGVDRNIDGR